ncbi:type II secretion system F family protein [Intestinirhabdus alba]|jgi:tight adherence protein C|uniref:Type II secretion system F family protein n=1 Tax=Intestinirhabdus alba TaxID=2899544 RepID=A0A6L6IIR3_9ENTR|nr:type II secretion system F family protein [Intestinirhabdus alba]MTH45578.1 type II secretion system F family protein [Intestinirhabdus alba]
MNLFYLSLLLLGVILIALAVRQLLLWKKNQQFISSETNDSQVIQTQLDYREMIIDNSQWLRFLRRLDEDLTLKLRICAFFAGGLLVGSFTHLLSISLPSVAVCTMLFLVAIIVLPALLTGPVIKTKIKLMLDALPYFVDLTAVCVQAGMTVESAIKFIAERSDELDINLGSLMRHLIKRAEVSGLEDALMEIYRSMDQTELRMFCSTLQQSVHYGTSLYENLMELSKDIRMMQLLESEEKIGKLSAKMSVPLILFIMFPITILIAAPGILRIMKNAIF